MINFNQLNNFRFSLNDKSGKKMIAIYDLDKINCSHDFLVFFQCAYNFKKMNKIKNMDVMILSGSVNGFKKQQFKKEKSFKLDFAKSRLENIVFPSLNMFAKFFDNIFFVKDRKEFQIFETKKKYDFLFPDDYNPNMNKHEYTKKCQWVNLEKNKEFEFAKLNVSKVLSQKIREYLNTKKKIITITLRESGYTRFRNSKLSEWKKFINHINESKFKIIVIRDFEKVGTNDFFRKYELFPQASVNISFRSSLYKLAYLNLFVSNGPQTICWINNYNSISWKVWGSGNNKLLFDQNLGFSKETGSRILNKKNQILLAEEDTFKNILKYTQKFI